MTTLLRDLTGRTGATPDPAKWLVVGPSKQYPSEGSGSISFAPVFAYARHVIGNISNPSSDQGIVLTFAKTSSTATSRLRLWVSHDQGTSGSTGENATNAVGLSVDANGGGIALTKVAAGSSTTLGSVAAKAPANNTPYRARLERTAGRLRARVWTVSTTEPSTWDLDVADDTGLAVGLAAFSHYRTGSGGANFTVSDVEVYTPAGGIPESPRPKLLRRPNGDRVPFGRSVQRFSDDATQAAPTWLTGSSASTLDTVNGLRTLPVADAASSALTLPQVAGEAIVLTISNFRLSADTNVGCSLKFTDGAKTYELLAVTTLNQARLVVDGITTVLPYWLRSNAEGPKHRTITLALLPTARQILFLEGTLEHGTVEGFATLPATVSRTSAITPSVTVSSTSGAQSMSYTNLDLVTQRL